MDVLPVIHPLIVQLAIQGFHFFQTLVVTPHQLHICKVLLAKSNVTRDIIL